MKIKFQFYFNFYSNKVNKIKENVLTIKIIFSRIFIENLFVFTINVVIKQ